MEELSDYELQRLQQIALNRQMLLSLGLGDGLGIRAEVEARQQQRVVDRRQQKEHRQPTQETLEPQIARRSSRLLGKPLPSYDENKAAARRVCDAEDEDEAEETGVEGLKDVYTVKQLNALRNCKVPYDAHPDRLLRKANGFGVQYSERCRGVVPCHWHRHNTRDPHVKCANGTKCLAANHKWKGSYWCGPCLQNRYGENIFEIGVASEKDFVYPPQDNYLAPPPDSWDCMANAQKPGWICPACRDICNCSARGCMRDRRGWGDTGALVGRAMRKGYDSSAHYLVMGHFDALLTGLELGIYQKDLRALRRHVAVATYTLSQGADGSAEVVQAHQLLRKEGESAAEPEVLFCYGATAKQVVERLAQLMDKANSLLSASGCPTAVEASSAPETIQIETPEGVPTAPLAEDSVGPSLHSLLQREGSPSTESDDSLAEKFHLAVKDLRVDVSAPLKRPQPGLSIDLPNKKPRCGLKAAAPKVPCDAPDTITASGEVQ